MSKQMNIGILGTAKVAEHAMVKAAKSNRDVCIRAVAARDGDKAAAYAARHGIEHSFSGYQSLLDRDEIDAVYLPLANHVHEEWAIEALRAGKHVLCE
ncbi:MAG: Gfo/Idh/MocA family protein, partial [Pseudomonadales bacterium]